MALTLTDALAVPTTLAPAIRLTITGTVPDAIEAGYLFRLEDEVLELKYFGKTEETILGGAAQQTVDDRNIWYARRGVDNTAIVSHVATTAVKGVADALLAGTTEVVPAPPFGAAGDATVPTLEEVLAAGNDTGGASIVRGATGGDQANLALQANSVDGDAYSTSGATATGSGGAYAGRVATTEGAGEAVANTSATANGDGNAAATTTAGAAGAGVADVTARATAFTTGDAQAGAEAVRGAAKAGMTAIVDATSARMGFNGTTPIAVPEVPANPTPQDIADTLVALGLITQAV